MLFKPARNNPGKQRVSQSKTIPAPVGGWNARDPLDKMKPEDAIVLDNWFPSTGTTELRKGSSLHVVGVGQLDSFTRSGSSTYFDTNGTLQTAGSDEPRYSWRSMRLVAYDMPQLIIEDARTNYCLYNRDLTNAAWTKSNGTAVKNITGLDGTANTASRFTATSANATVTQAITATTGGALYIYLKRITGIGTIQLTVDGGSNWTTVSVTSTTSWSRYELTGAGTNPTVGIKVASSGDAIAIDFVHLEVGTESYPIATTSASVTTADDTPTYQTGASATAVTTTVDTLISYASGSTKKLLAAGGGGIYDATAGGTGVGIPLVSSLSNNRWQYENIGGYAVMVNGADTPLKYDGSTISTTTFTGSGLTATNLIHINLFKGRLFLLENNTLNVWYHPTLGAIAGALSKLDFSQYCKEGGYMMASATWSRDGGSGSDDFIVFITSNGEVLIYQGSDPGVSTSWALVGVFKVGAPIGRRCFMKSGSDLVIICEDGFVPLSEVLPIDRVGAEAAAISDKIRSAVSGVAKGYGNNFGWQPIFYPGSNMALFNIPVIETSTSHQYVVNTITGAWCRFTGWNAMCFGIYNKKLYFGGKYGTVCLADDGTSDFEATSAIAGGQVAIDYDSKQAFTYLGNKESLKHFKMIRPILTASAGANIGYAINVDFEDRAAAATLSTGAASSLWNESYWNITYWNGGTQNIKNWLSAPGSGYCVSVRLRIQSKSISASLNSTGIMYESGGMI